MPTPKLCSLCRQSPAEYTDLNVAQGTVTFLAQGQEAGADAALFTGSNVALADVVFRVKKAAVSNGSITTSIQVGSELDPVFLTSAASNGDDISKQQSHAQVGYQQCLPCVHQDQSKNERQPE